MPEFDEYGNLIDDEDIPYEDQFDEDEEEAHLEPPSLPPSPQSFQHFISSGTPASIPSPSGGGNFTWSPNIILQPSPSLTIIDGMEQWQASLPQGDKPMARPVRDKEPFYNQKLSRVIGFRNGPVKGSIGLEIECEGSNLFRAPFKYWVCHEDGSLRAHGDHPPVEYVLKEPLEPSEVQEALNYLGEKLKDSKSKIVKSQRTSVHVHVNCQKMLVRELYTFLCLYLIFEELLTEWAGPERAGNLFCLRAKDSEFYLGMLEGALKQGNFKFWKDDYRYSACNVASIPKFGSLEFRAMQGTVNFDMIMMWIKILILIRDQAGKYSSPVEIVEEFTNIGPLPFFRKIFSEAQLRRLFETSPNLSGKLWDGLRMMRDIAYSCEWKPVSKKSEEPEEEFPKSKYEVGDTYTLLNGDIKAIHRIRTGRFRFQDTETGNSYTLQPSSGLEILYVALPNGNYLFLEQREQT